MEAFDIIFFVFAALTIWSSILVFFTKNAVNAAMFMIVTFIGMAGMFVLLESYFLAVIQILVYAGAIMVLFLFIIMLLNVEEGVENPSKLVMLGSTLVCALMMFATVYAFSPASGIGLPNLFTRGEAPEMASLANPLGYATSAKSFGYGLFTKYMLPFQLTAFMLLVAMIGVIYISRQPSSKSESSEQNS